MVCFLGEASLSKIQTLNPISPVTLCPLNLFAGFIELSQTLVMVFIYLCICPLAQAPWVWDCLGHFHFPLPGTALDVEQELHKHLLIDIPWPGRYTK